MADANLNNSVKRKTGIANVELKSESVFLYMRGQSGETLNKALNRIGELFKMTSRSANKTSYNMIKEWFDTEIVSKAKVEIESLVEQLETHQENSVLGINFVDLQSPEMKIEVPIIHNSHIEIINLISNIDYIMDDIETLSLAGAWDDENIEQHARTQSLLILNNVAHKIYKVTKPGKRNGGPFSPIYFLEQLQAGVFTLYPDNENKQVETSKTSMSKNIPEIEVISNTEIKPEDKIEVA